MLRFPLLLLLASTPWAIPPEALKGLKNPVPGAQRQASAARGQALYVKECLGCHGAKGKGDGPDGLYFTTAPSDLTTKRVQTQTDAELFWKLSQGRGDMKAYEKVYDAAQRWDLVNAVRALK